MLINIMLITVWILITISFSDLKQEREQSRLLISLVFSAYIVSVLYLTLLNRDTHEDIHYNLKLFWSYKDMLMLPGNYYFEQIILNILLFVPFGFLPVLLIKKLDRVKAILPLAFLFSLYIELSQLIFRRGLFELDDLFNNSLGALIGYGIYYSYHSLVTKQIDKTRRFMLGLLPCLTVSAFFLVVYVIKV